MKSSLLTGLPLFLLHPIGHGKFHGQTGFNGVKLVAHECYRVTSERGGFTEGWRIKSRALSIPRITILSVMNIKLDLRKIKLFGIQ